MNIKIRIFEKFDYGFDLIGEGNFDISERKLNIKKCIKDLESIFQKDGNKILVNLIKQDDHYYMEIEFKRRNLAEVYLGLLRLSDELFSNYIYETIEEYIEKKLKKKSKEI